MCPQSGAVLLSHDEQNSEQVEVRLEELIIVVCLCSSVRVCENCNVEEFRGEMLAEQVGCGQARCGGGAKVPSETLTTTESEPRRFETRTFL